MDHTALLSETTSGSKVLFWIFNFCQIGKSSCALPITQEVGLQYGCSHIKQDLEMKESLCL